MKTIKKSFLLLFLLVISSLMYLNIKTVKEIKKNEIVYEGEVKDMTTHGYKKENDIDGDFFPINSHLCIETEVVSDTFYIYFVPFQNTLTIRKLDPTDGTSTLIVTEGGAITKFYYDRANSKVYYYYNQANFSYVDLSDDSITDLTPTLDACEDIFIYDGDLFAADTSEDDLTFYKYNAGGPSWDAVGTIAEGVAQPSFNIGALGGNDVPIGICWDDTNFFVTDNGDAHIYKYPSDFSVLTASYNIGALGDNDNPTGICWDGTYFYVVDAVDAVIYKYNAALDTEEATYNIGVLGGNDNPYGICWDSTYFYVADNDGYIYKYPSDFSVLTASYNIGALGGNDSPHSITWDGTYFYVSDSIDAYIYKYNAALDILIDSYDIGVLGGNDTPFGITWDDNYFYVVDGVDDSVYKYTSNLKTDLGMITYVAVISNNVYLVYQYINQDAKIYVKDLDDATNPSLLETLASDLLIPYLENQRGIAVSSDNNVLLFVMKDSDDLKTYLCKYEITEDAFTKSAEYNISLMLSRNSNSGNPLPMNAEKGFGVESGVNNLMIFQISINGKYLYKIADLTNISDFSTYSIKAITDRFIFAETGGGVILGEYQDMSNHIISAEIKHCERDYPTCEIIYDIRSLVLTSDMFIQIIGTLESVADQVIFEGYVEKPELLDERGKYVYIATLRSPAYRDLDYASPYGEYAGRSDQHITSDITENDGYITVGTLSNGQALGTFNYAMDKARRTVYNELAVGDQFTWALTPTGGVLYNNGAVDSGVNYSEATPIDRVHISHREVRVNWVQVKGAYVGGIQIKSAVREDKELQQQYGGKIKFEITLGNVNTVALANAWGDAFLALLGAQMTEVTFRVRDTTNGFIQPSKEITLSYSKIPVIASAQYKINQILYNDRTKITEYVVSSIVRYEMMDFRGKLSQDNQELIDQTNTLINTIAGGLAIYLHQDASADVGGYRMMCTDVPNDVKTEVLNTTVTADDQELEQWVTDIGCPGITELLAGVVNLHCHVYKFSGTKDLQIYYKFYKRTHPGGVETLIGTSTESEILGDNEDEEDIHMLIETTSLDATDRLVMKLFARLTGVGSNPVIYFYVEGTGVNETITRLQVPVSAIQASDLNNHIALEETAHGGSLCRIATGQYDGDDANDKLIEVGFEPKLVWINVLNGNTIYMVIANYTAWRAIRQHDATVFTNFATITSGQDGFRVNNNEANDNLNNLGTTYSWIAWG